VVRSVRGPNGGFYQTDKERKLSLRTVLKVMGEDEMLDKCVLGLKKCSEVNPCPMHFQYKPIKKEMMTMFVEKTIQQLADEMNDGGLFIKNKKR
jgi:DNA-binding IscR family transcriptional regulator